jgi:hypothetical protein
MKEIPVSLTLLVIKSVIQLLPLVMNCGTFSIKQSTPVTNATVIMCQYLELAYEDRKSNPAQFWNKHKSSMPQLHQLAL